MGGHSHTEGEANTSAARGEWSAKQNDAPTRQLLKRDAEVFLHQALSSPCVSTIAKAEGIWIEDTAGKRYMDFHGNSQFTAFRPNRIDSGIVHCDKFPG